jgi:hypothetical protein
MIGEPIEKLWPFARRADVVLTLAGVACMIASQLLNAPDPASGQLHRRLEIAAVVSWIVGLGFLIRWHATKSGRAI